MLTPTTSPSTSAAGAAQHSSTDRLLPTAGQTLTATVRSVASDSAGGKVFRIQVEVNSRLLELTTQAPLNQGDRILLQRGTGGELQIRLPAPPPARAQNQTASAPSGLLLQLASADRQLQQMLPLNSARTAQVISSKPAGTQPPATTQGSASIAATRPAAEPSSTGQPSSPAARMPTPPAQPAAGGGSAPVQTGTASPATPVSVAPATPASGGQVYSAQLQPVTADSTPPTHSTGPATSTTVSTTATSTSTAPPPPAPPATSAAASQAPATTAATPAAPAGTTPAPPATSTIPATPAGAPTPAATAEASSQAATSRQGQALLQMLSQQSSPRPDSHLVELRLNNQTFSLISPRPLLSSQQVVLTRISDQQVSLQPLPLSSGPVDDIAARQSIQQALREALPRQIPFADALNQMVQLSQSPAGRSQSAIGQLVQSMLSMFSVTPGSTDAHQAIQRNLQLGGLFSESGLIQGRKGAPGAPADLKQQLGQLLKAAEKLPPDARQQMTRLIEALQARSTARQISSLQGWKEQPDGTLERVYRLDLPIRQADHHDNAELIITEQHRRNSQGEPETLWGVALHFDLEEYGPLDARLSLSEGWRLQIQFWAEEALTLHQIERRLEEFSAGLHRQGFLVESLQARQGRPAQPELTDIQRHLVDIHT